MIVSNISDVLLAIKHKIENLYKLTYGKDLNIIYDNNLSYESGVKLGRSQSLVFSENILDGIKKEKTLLPLLLFKRNVLKYNEHIGRLHSRRGVIDKKDIEDIKIYQSIYGTFDIEFLFISNKITDIENFEIFYYIEDGIQQLKNFTVNIPNVGESYYQIFWNEMDNFTIEVENNFYKALGFTGKVSGHYFNYDGDAKLIEKVLLNVYGNNEVITKEINQ